MSGKYTKALSFYITALLALSAGKNRASADLFINPERNSYSLERTMDRPYLQSVPVPQVWQTDSSSDEFKRHLLDATLPETAEERYFNANLWQMDELDHQDDYQTIFFDDKLMNYYIASNAVNDSIPISDEAIENVLYEIGNLDVGMAIRERLMMTENAREWKDEFLNIRTYLSILKEIAPKEAEMEIVEAFFRNKDKQEYRILTETKKEFLPEAILDKAQAADTFEVTSLNEIRYINEVLSSLELNDLLDLATGIGTMEEKDSYSGKEYIENKPKSASILDRKQKNNQIQGSTLPAEKQALILRMQERLKQENKKDAK